MAQFNPDLGKDVELTLKGSGEKVGEGSITYTGGGNVQIITSDGIYHMWSQRDVDVHEKND